MFQPMTSSWASGGLPRWTPRHTHTYVENRKETHDLTFTFFGEADPLYNYVSPPECDDIEGLNNPFVRDVDGDLIFVPM